MYYVVCTQDDRHWISKAILAFSSLAFAENEYDHVFLAKGVADSGYLETYDQTYPTVRHLDKLYITSDIYTVYAINSKEVGYRAWRRAEDSYYKKERYGVGQLITMAWSVITGRLPFIRKGKVCSEAVAYWLYGKAERWMEILTVGRVIDKMLKDGVIKKI